MLLNDKLQEIINLLGQKYKFEVLKSMDDDEIDDASERELMLQFPPDIKVSVEDIKDSIKNINGIKTHIVITMNIVAILIDVNEPHIA